MLPFPPEDVQNHCGEWFMLTQRQTVCRLKRETEFVRPVRLTGAEFMQVRVDGFVVRQWRLILFFDFGPTSNFGWAVNLTDVVKLIPVVTESRKENA